VDKVNRGIYASGRQAVDRALNKPDFEVQNEGSIYLLRPMSEGARIWCAEHLPEDAPRFGVAYAVEHRYIRDIVEGVMADGYNVTWDQRS
jgi:hypothetical protein